MTPQLGTRELAVAVASHFLSVSQLALALPVPGTLWGVGGRGMQPGVRPPQGEDGAAARRGNGARDHHESHPQREGPLQGAPGLRRPWGLGRPWLLPPSSTFGYSDVLDKFLAGSAGKNKIK